MSVMNTNAKWGSVAKFLHWLIFVLLLGMLTVGFCFGYVPKEWKGAVYNTHKVVGVVILFLMIFRLCWAIINPKPALPPLTPFWQKLAERVVHGMLYLLVIAMPLVGWIGSSSAQKYPHIGDWKLALPIEKNRDLITTMFDFHELIAYAIIAFASIHILAALYHHFIKRDDILKRMLPW